jgi:hypothetical protein
MSSKEAYRWMMVDDFVTNFNDHRAEYFIPSHPICVDESMSCWYGQGGEWINMGLPCYVAISRKPENGCEIQNAACGKSGVMLRLKLVKSSAEEKLRKQAADSDEALWHGTRVLKYLVQPWFNTSRNVCADSYFAPVGGRKSCCVAEPDSSEWLISDNQLDAVEKELRRKRKSSCD